MQKTYTALLTMLLLISALAAQGYSGDNGRPRDSGNRQAPNGENQRPAPPDNDNNDKNLKEFHGYLVDYIWGSTGKTDTGKDIFKQPSLITLKHLKSEECVAAGYGIIVQTPDQQSRFLKFDASGNLRVSDLLASSKTRKNKIAILAKGYLTQSEIITVISLENDEQSTDSRENQPPMPQGGRPH